MLQHVAEGIQFDFTFNRIRYRPSIKRRPSEANLRRARERLEAIKHQIHLGTFSFEEEFPDYRFLRRLGGASSARLCSDVFDAYLAHCEARLRRNDMAAATGRSYRKILDGIWRPHLGSLVFSQVRYSRLIAVADGHSWSKKTYNNSISVLKRAFEFGYRDRPVHPSEQIALVLSNVDLVQGIISVNKARVSASIGIKRRRAKIAAFNCVLARCPF
ncbi:MAG: Arm DNA-binding domain-containing protein [Steroidobacteraceae bacterium]